MLNKKIIIALAGTGTAATAGTTATLLGGGSGDAGDVASNSDPVANPPEDSEIKEPKAQQPEKVSQTPAPEVHTPPQTSNNDWLGGIKSNSHDNTNKYFGSGMAFNNATFDTHNAPTTRNDDFYGTGFKVANYDSKKSGAGRDIKTNLIITVERKQYGDSSKYSGNRKGSGTMTWFWSFVNEKTKKGFITFNKAKTDATKQGLVLTGYFYLLEKGNDNKGKVKYKKEVKDSDKKTLTRGNFEKYFPRPYYYTEVGGFDKVYYTNWDFINSGEELNGKMATICDEGVSGINKCPETPTKTIKQEGEWEGYTGEWWESHDNGWHAKGYNRPHHWYGVYHQTRTGERTGKDGGYDFMYGNDKFSLHYHLFSFSYGTGKPKEGKGFRREGDNQQLRGDNSDGWAI